MPLGSRMNRTATLTKKEVTCIHNTSPANFQK